MSSDRIRREVEKKLNQRKKEEDRRAFKLKLCQSLGIDVDARNRKFPIVEDWDDLSRELTEFRKGHNAYFSTPGILENGEMQSRSTQAYWHVCYLQKKRMNRLGVTMEIKSDRRDFRKGHIRAYSPPIHQDRSTDGRYEINNVREEITATKRYIQNGSVIGKYEFEEAAAYYVLSTQPQGDDQILCPNCGAVTTKEDLIDGCDFCGTKFTIEDLQDKIGAFSFKEDEDFRLMKEKGKEPSPNEQYSEYAVDKHFYDAHGKELRAHDPNFSLFDFFTNVHNKIAMIHYADDQNQVNAFSLIDLSEARSLHKNIVDLDIYSTKIDMYSNKYPPYEVKDGLQYIRTTSYINVYVLEEGKIEKRHEIISMELVKSAGCKTASIHSPSVMKCKGCGSSLSLLDGKACLMCGRQINLIEQDWVVNKYLVWSGYDRNQFE